MIVADVSTNTGASKDQPISSSIRPTDAVQASLASGVGFLEKNSKLFIALLVVALLAGLGYMGFQFVSSRQEKAAQEAYYAVESEYSKIREGFDRAKFSALIPQDANAEAPKSEPPTGDLQKDYGKVIAGLETVAREHQGTAGGAQAAILAAEIYLLYNQPEKAAELAQIPAQSLPSNHILGNLSKVLWGSSLATKGDCQAAVGVWQGVLDTKSASYLHPDVSLRSGVCYENLNQPEKAAEMYRKVTAEAADSAPAATAKGLLRALELKSKPVNSTSSASQG